MSQVPTRPEPTNAQLEDRILAGFEELRTLIARLSLTGGSPVATGPVPNLTDAPGTVAYNAPRDRTQTFRRPRLTPGGKRNHPKFRHSVTLKRGMGLAGYSRLWILCGAAL